MTDAEQSRQKPTAESATLSHNAFSPRTQTTTQ